MCRSQTVSSVPLIQRQIPVVRRSRRFPSRARCAMPGSCIGNCGLRTLTAEQGQRPRRADEMRIDAQAKKPEPCACYPVLNHANDSSIDLRDHALKIRCKLRSLPQRFIRRPVHLPEVAGRKAIDFVSPRPVLWSEPADSTLSTFHFLLSTFSFIIRRVHRHPRRLGLHHRRRRKRRLRPRQPAVGQSRHIACCCSKPAARMTGSGLISRSVTSTRSPIHVPTGATRPSLTSTWRADRSTMRAARSSAGAPPSTP